MLSDAMADGYISDVPTIPSMYSASELSGDPHHNAHYLSAPSLDNHGINNNSINGLNYPSIKKLAPSESEQYFKEKYQSLRAAYEERIIQLSSMVEETCRNLTADEVILEMKNDAASSVFIPAHIREIFVRYLDSERETFIHQCVEKISGLDLSNKKYKKMAANYQHELALKLRENFEKEKEFVNIIESTKQELNEKSKECENFKKLVEKKTHDLSLLEHSFEQSTRELALMEGLDQQEQRARYEMKSQMLELVNQRSILSQENADLRSKVISLNEEIQRHETTNNQIQQTEEINRERLRGLMSQVEEILEQEATESTSTINVLHSKMKAFRNRVVAELQREKRLTTALQEELSKLKTVRDDSSRDNRRLLEEERILREKLAHEQQRVTLLQDQIHQANVKISELKMELSESSSKCKSFEEKLEEKSKFLQQELQLVEEKAKLSAKQQFEEEQRLVEQRLSSYRLRYENELGKLASAGQLRHSYTFGSSITDAAVEGRLELHELLLRISTEKEELEKKHREDLEQLEHRMNLKEAADIEELQHIHQVTLGEIHQQHQSSLKKKEALLKASKKQFEFEIDSLKKLLAEASKNIDKLKSMVREGRTVIDLQTQRIEQYKIEQERQHNIALVRQQNRASPKKPTLPESVDEISRNEESNAIKQTTSRDHQFVKASASSGAAAAASDKVIVPSLIRSSPSYSINEKLPSVPAGGRDNDLKDPIASAQSFQPIDISQPSRQRQGNSSMSTTISRVSISRHSPFSSIVNASTQDDNSVLSASSFASLINERSDLNMTSEIPRHSDLIIKRVSSTDSDLTAADITSVAGSELLVCLPVLSDHHSTSTQQQQEYASGEFLVGLSKIDPEEADSRA